MGMNQTPASERVHISFFGKRNAGKSSVINAVTGQDLAIVSQVKGTTTDPVYKTMELLPLGPVVVIDTPGIDDEGELGKLRIRKSGSAGGHNGLKNIILHLGTEGFPRLKIGVGGKPHPDYDMADWVLSKFTGEDKKLIDAAIERAADAVECFLREGVDKAMGKFN